MPQDLVTIILVANIYSKFRFKKSTVGLVTAEEFKRRRDIIENGIDSSVQLKKRAPKTKLTDEEKKAQRKKLKKKKKKMGKLSFMGDEDEEMTMALKKKKKKKIEAPNVIKYDPEKKHREEIEKLEKQRLEKK